jgi:phenylalanyl-tRNA synthetase beta chain
MALGIRTEAAQMNEKGLDPEIAYEALLFGIKQYQQLAGGKILTEIIDLYPTKPQPKTVSVTEAHINNVIGVPIPLKQCAAILEKLGFQVTVSGDTIQAVVPSFRLEDIAIPEDLIEEIARVYGYQNIPDALPPVTDVTPSLVEDAFYWENRVKQAMKYWGYTEAYTYPMVSEQMYEGELDRAVKLKNPLGEEFAYMRLSLIPSLLKVIAENKKYETIKLFEIANVYEREGKTLPKQTQHLAGVVKQKNASFFSVKGLIEQLAADLGIENLTFKPLSDSGIETELLIGKTSIGTLEMLDDELIDFELNFDELVKHATTHKTFTPLQKYPPVIEDLALVVNEAVTTGAIMETIRKVSPLIVEVTLLDKYENSRTFHIVYRSDRKNLTSGEVGKIRENVLKTVKEKHHATLKS